MDAKKDLRKDARKALKGKNISVKYKEANDKYSKQRFVYVFKGYDFLENITVVRHYIQKRYDIDWFTLEILIKLMGMKVFTRSMFAEIPKNFTNSRWKNFKTKGYLNLVMDHNNNDEQIWTLNTKGQNIVKSFYEYLSGEKKIPEDSVNNPMFNKKKQVSFDKKKVELIKKLNQLDVPEHKRFLFE